MKHSIFKTTFLLLLILFSASSYAKSFKPSSVADSCSATINQDKLITVSGNQVCSNYYADISLMGFTSEAAATDYFSRYSCNLVSFQLIYNQQKVKVILHNERLSTAWTVQQWNQYLQNKNLTFIN